MFTGIVKGIGEVSIITKNTGLHSITLVMPVGFLANIEEGASVAVDGVCLTVTTFSQESVTFDVMIETLRCTSLGDLDVGSLVNVERSAREGVEIGGHPISGHIDGRAQITAVDMPENNHVITFKVPAEWTKYIFNKGYIALNGASLTVADVDKKNGTFKVYLIPETLKLTTFGEKAVGDIVNFEIERQTQVMVDTVIHFLEDKLASILPEEKIAIELSAKLLEAKK